MYRELVSKYINENQWAAIEKPCLDTKIQEAEKIVGYPFPQELKNLLLEMNGDRWLLLSAEQMIENVHNNRLYLAECYEGIDRHIFFATNGCGDYYCYNIFPNGKVDTSAIFIWEHETNETHAVASDISELIRRYYRDEI
jgi:cell wall assembly regulator SMI1